MSLKIANNLELPVGLFNKRLAILAMQGAGKTYAAGVIEEEMMDYIIENPGINAKLIIIDAVGAHWGLREKYPIHIIGGDRGDIEIDVDSGHKFAELSHKLNLSMILDLSKLSQEEATNFVTDFSEKIFELTKTPTHIIFEEADMFAPQRAVFSKQKFSLAAIDSIVRRGRGRGLGCTMITQRPAVLNKNVLTQVDASILLNISGETDLKTIREYLDSAGIGKKEISGYIEKIIKFGKGEALLFSPSWLKTIKEIKIRERISFHSGAEPELGKQNSADFVKLVQLDIQPLVNTLNGREISPILKSAIPRENEYSIISETKIISKKDKELGLGTKLLGVAFFAFITWLTIFLFS